MSAALRSSNPQRSAPAPESASTTVARSVLIVEDNALVALGLQMLFEQHGWKVRQAARVADALPLLSERPEWVILDLMLPDGDGADVLEEIRNARLATRVAVMTGAADPVRRDAVQRLRPDLFFLKPVSGDALFKALS